MTNENSKTFTCPNCNHSLQEDVTFCPKCGQRRQSTRLSVSELLSETVVAFLGYDSQVWRTLKHIWSPGKLPLQFRDGHRKSFVHPVRLFFFSFVVLALIANFASNSVNVNQGENVLIFTKDNDENEEGTEVVTDLDSLFGGDSLAVFFIKGKSIDEPFLIPKSWLDNYSLDEIVNLIGPKSNFQAYHIKQQLKLYKSESSYSEVLVDSLIWMFLIIQPVLALFLLLVMWRSTYFSDHLIWTVYTHAAIFVILIPFFVLSTVSEVFQYGLADLLRIAVMAGCVVYVAISLKRYYTLKKRYLLLLLPYVLAVYLITFLIAFIFNLVITFFLF